VSQSTLRCRWPPSQFVIEIVENKDQLTSFSLSARFYSEELEGSGRKHHDKGS